MNEYPTDEYWWIDDGKGDHRKYLCKKCPNCNLTNYCKVIKKYDDEYVELKEYCDGCLNEANYNTIYGSNLSNAYINECKKLK